MTKKEAKNQEKKLFDKKNGPQATRWLTKVLVSGSLGFAPPRALVYDAPCDGACSQQMPTRVFISLALGQDEQMPTNSPPQQDEEETYFNY